MRRTTYTTDQLVDALIHAYTEVIRQRREVGNTWTGLTRVEYQENKRDEDPDYWTIERILGSWSTFTSLVPSTDHAEIVPRNRDTIKGFRDSIVTIAKDKGVPAHQVTVRDFMAHQRANPERGLHDWRTYASILGVSTWRETRQQVL